MFDDGCESLDYGDPPTPTPNVGLGRLASQLPDSRPPTTLGSSCSDDETKIIPVGKKENWAPRLERPQVDRIGPDKKPIVTPPLEKYRIPKIKTQPRVPLWVPGSLEPNMAALV
uniref:Uncharacterized protein n=1 Tax=Romanomermis culicivorax TaxID=13658 RepID=A0A915KL87_ROMCU